MNPRSVPETAILVGRARSLLLLAGLAPLACSRDVSAEASETSETRELAQAITNGQTASSAAYDGIGMVFFSPAFVCTGFLVSSNVVITAAHCFEGARVPVAFYTGVGAPVAAPSNVPTIPGLVDHPLKASARHPSAVTTPSDIPRGSYPWKFDVAYVVLQNPTTLPKLGYGQVPSSTSTCTLVGYGTDSLTNSGGTGGVRRQGSITLSPTPSGLGYSNLLGSPGPNLANRGDSGGPVLCNGQVAGVFSVLSWDDNFVVDSNVHIGTNGVVKTWIDGIVSANAPPPPSGATDAGAADAGRDGGGGTADGGATAVDADTTGPGAAADEAEGAREPAQEDVASSGCTMVSPRRRGAHAVAALLALASVATLRRRRRRAG